MPRKVSKKVKQIVPPDDNRLYAIDKEFFTFQFDAKENTIARLKDDCIILDKSAKEYNKKANNLNIKLKNEYDDSKKLLEEKNNLEKKLKAEIEDLLQEKNSMVEMYRNKLKVKDDEFMRAAGVIKTSTAVYIGRLNKLKEYFKQEKMLEEKLVSMKDQIEVMNKNYEVKLKNLEEKYIHYKKVIQKAMLKRCSDFALHINKQFMSKLHPRVQESANEILDLEEMLNIFQALNSDLEEQTLQIREENKRFIRQIKSNKKNIDTLNETYLIKKENVKRLKKEMADVMDDVNNMLENLNKDTSRTGEEHQNKLRSAVNDTVRELDALKNDMQKVEKEISRIQAKNGELDEFIWEIKDALLKVYGETLNKVEEIKTSNRDDHEEKLMELFQQLYDELKSEPFITIPENSDS